MAYFYVGIIPLIPDDPNPDCISAVPVESGRPKPKGLKDMKHIRAGNSGEAIDKYRQLRKVRPRLRLV
jgi:hypothetical protein